MDIKKIKQRLDSHQELNAARTRLAELTRDLQTAQEEHAAAQQRLHESFLTHSDDKAKALIERRSVAGVDSLRDSEVRCREHVAIIKRAIELQSQTVRQLHCKISEAICGELRGEHAKLGAAIAEAALRLREANRQEMEFRQQLDAAGVRVDLPSMVFLYFETLEGNSALDGYLLERKAA